jgi:hypothetical protein
MKRIYRAIWAVLIIVAELIQFIGEWLEDCAFWFYRRSRPDLFTSAGGEK